eukprot:1045297-Rhodomonas_salina.1
MAAAQVEKGSSCAVFGLGAVGLAVIYGCKMAGAEVSEKGHFRRQCNDGRAWAVYARGWKRGARSAEIALIVLRVTTTGWRIFAVDMNPAKFEIAKQVCVSNSTFSRAISAESGHSVSLYVTSTDRTSFSSVHLLSEVGNTCRNWEPSPQVC